MSEPVAPTTRCVMFVRSIRIAGAESDDGDELETELYASLENKATDLTAAALQRPRADGYLGGSRLRGRTLADDDKCRLVVAEYGVAEVGIDNVCKVNLGQSTATLMHSRRFRVIGP